MEYKDTLRENTPSVATGKKVRLSNIELLRLLAMLMVMMLHVNYLSLGFPGQADFAENPLPAFIRVAFESLSIVAVNVFVLISGWFGIRPSLKGLCNLLFQVAFITALVSAFCLAFCRDESDMSTPRYLTAVLSVSGCYQYFFVAYLMLYVLSPVLNAFVHHCTQRQLRLFLIAYFALEFTYGFLLRVAFENGYSLDAFIGLYMLAQYVRRYPSDRWLAWSAGRFLLLYFLMVLLSTVVTVFLMCNGLRHGFMISYVSPLVVAGSLFLVMAFVRFRLQSRFVNWMAASCFSIYLIHNHVWLHPYYTGFFGNVYSRFSGIEYLLVTLFCILAIGMACILVDQLRIFCWRRLLSFAARKHG